MCNEVYNSAGRPNISMTFGTKVLNWSLNDHRNLYYKHTPDSDIIKEIRRGSIFWRTCIIGTYYNTGPRLYDI